MNKNSIVFKTTLMITVILMTAFFCACEKNESIDANRNTIAESIVSFADYEDYNRTLNKVLAMNEEELKNYEESEGYKSFGRASEEFYRSIKWDEFKSKEDIISFVEQNCHYLQLIEDENGELELEARFYNRPERYFLNQDNIYQIGESVYKLFEEGIVLGTSEDINALTNPNNDLNFFKTNSRFDVMTNSETGLPSLKSTNGDCGTSHTWRSTNRKNRLKVQLEFLFYKNDPPHPVGVHYYLYARSLARPYKRTLGIWYWCTRTMMIDAEYAHKWWETDNCYFKDELEYGWNFYDWYHFEPFTRTSKMEHVISMLTCSSNPNESYTSFDVYADTYDVSPISVSCD